MAAGGWQVVAAVKNRDRGSLPRGVGVGMAGDGKGKGHRSGAAFVVPISHHAIHTYHVVVHLPCPCIHPSIAGRPATVLACGLGVSYHPSPASHDVDADTPGSSSAVPARTWERTPPFVAPCSLARGPGKVGGVSWTLIGCPSLSSLILQRLLWLWLGAGGPRASSGGGGGGGSCNDVPIRSLLSHMEPGSDRGG